MESKDMLAVVETLYVMARGGVVGTPGNVNTCIKRLYWLLITQKVFLPDIRV